MDFEGPVNGKNKYVLFFVRPFCEFSRYPFAFPCSNISSSTVIKGLSQLFCLLVFPACIHSDRGSAFASKDLKQYLNSRGISCTPYHPTGNAQCERINQTIWRTLLLLLRTYKQPNACWEAFLPEALHALRSLLCTATNFAPHKRVFGFPRRSMIGKSLPSWLTQSGSFLLRQFVRSKSDPLVEEVKLLKVNPSFATVRFPNAGSRMFLSLTLL